MLALLFSCPNSIYILFVLKFSILFHMLYDNMTMTVIYIMILSCNVIVVTSC